MATHSGFLPGESHGPRSPEGPCGHRVKTRQKRLSKHACDYPAKSENLCLSLHVNEHTVQLGHDFFNSPSTLKPLDYSHLGLLQKDCIVGSVAVLLYEHAQLFPWESFPKVKFLIQGVESSDEY